MMHAVGVAPSRATASQLKAVSRGADTHTWAVEGRRDGARGRATPPSPSRRVEQL